MKRMNLTIASLALSIFMLTGCFGGNWAMGTNIIADSGAIALHNGIDINFDGEVEIIADAEIREIEGMRVYSSTYQVSTEDGQFAYVLSQVSSAQTIVNLFGRTVSDEEYLELIGDMMESLLGFIANDVQGATIEGPVLQRRTEGNFDVGTSVYTVTALGIEADVTITTIVDRNNVVMVMTMREEGNAAANAIADEVEASIVLR